MTLEDFGLIADSVRQHFDAVTAVRDRALGHSRMITRYSAHAIRAIHRGEFEVMQQNLDEAHKLVEALKSELAAYPGLYMAGYTQDAIKEYVEACITYAFVEEKPLPKPDELDVEIPAYLGGLAEAASELRRSCLDILRQGYSRDVERLLNCMDEVYAVLVTLDYPDAVTGGLRRQTDMLRGVLERTRGDLTMSLRQHQLQQALERMISQIPDNGEA